MKTKITFLTITLILLGLPPVNAVTRTNGGFTYMMNMVKDTSTDFTDFTNIFFFADKLTSFTPQVGFILSIKETMLGY